MKDNDTVTIINHKETGAKHFNNIPMGKFLLVGNSGVVMEKPDENLLFQKLSSNIGNANIGNASSTITLTGNTATGISLPQNNITETEEISATVINGNNDSSLLLGENAVVVEDPTTPTTSN